MRNFLVAACLAFAAFLPACGQALPVPAARNVYYAGTRDTAQALDIYLPANRRAGRAPLIIYVHGGAFESWSKRPSNMVILQACLDSGYICADVNYRLSQQAVWPAQLLDVKAAIRYLRTKADSIGIDTCRIGMLGTSAGGTLVALAGTVHGDTALEGTRSPGSPSSSVQAVATLFGQSAILRQDGSYGPACGGGYVHSANSFDTRWLGCASLAACADKARAASAIYHADSASARFFIAHGTLDCIIPTNQSVLLDSALRAAGSPPPTLWIADGNGHGGTVWESYANSLRYQRFFADVFSQGCPQTVAIRPGLPANRLRAWAVSPTQVRYAGAPATPATAWLADAAGKRITLRIHGEVLHLPGPVAHGVYVLWLGMQGGMALRCRVVL